MATKHRHFLLNYGGPEDQVALGLEKIQTADTACRATYTPPYREEQFEIQGITVTVCTYGIHRALRMDIPDDASAELVSRFEQAANNAINFCKTEYDLSSNNCVTSVSNALHALDSRIAPGNTAWPWNLDKNVTNYKASLRYYQQDKSVAGDFMSRYMENANRDPLTFAKTPRWTKHSIDSSEDIIKHAYSSSIGKGERTKSTLIDLGWVKEDKHRVLRPTDKAPAEFKKGLEEYNHDYECMINLKNLYKSEAGPFSINAKKFFMDTPNYETALKRIQEQAQKNPNGASSRVLNRLDEQLMNAIQTDTSGSPPKFNL